MKITVLLHRYLLRSFGLCLRLGAGALLCLVCASAVRAADEAPGKLHFDIPGDDAIISLKAFAQQSGQEIIYSPDTVKGVRTNGIEGEYTPKEAIKQMLSGTALAPSQTSHGLIVVNRINDPNVHGAGQSPAASEAVGSDIGPPGSVPTPVQVIQGAATATSNGVTKLPPFEVQASSRDIGYYTQNTTMGTRLNSNLGDLGASITVISKQQMTDTSSVNINDLFLYEASTEGVENYTAVGGTSKGTGFGDTIQATPATANRVRGLGSVNVTKDYFITNPLIPLDTYNLDDVELSRGPNSTLFGIGTASGILNESIEKADLNKDSNQISAREGSFGDFRSTLNFNRALIPDKLAIAVAGLYANAHPTAQEPSFDIQRREFAAITLKPFPKTTIRANVEYLDNPTRHADSITPTDEVSPWLAAGSPKWDPITYSATVNGVTGAPVPFTSAVNDPAGLYHYFGNFGIGSSNFYLVHGKVQLWEQQQLGTNFSVPSTPTTASGTLGPIGNERMAIAMGNYAKFAGSAPAGQVTYPLFHEPGINNPNLLNWQGINMLSANLGEVKSVTYNVEVEQQILDNLFLEAGWFREQFSQVTHNYQSGNVGNAVTPDPNTRFLNGTPNPYFGLPYVPVQEPGDGYLTQPNEQERIALVYQLDFTKQSNWLKWLGHHTLQAYYQHREVDTSDLFTSEPVLDAHSWNTTTDIGANSAQNQVSIGYRYYLANSGSAVSYDPGSFINSNFTFPLTWYNTNLNGGTWTNENARLGPVWTTGGFADQQQVWSYSGSMQNYLLDDHLVLTLGQRHDYERVRTNLGLTGDPSNGAADLTNLTNYGSWTYQDGITRQAGGVVHLNKWLSVHYNQSDNFTVTSLGEDEFGNVLPAPTGTGKDYGISVAFFDDKLVAEMNWYKSNTLNSHVQASMAGRAVNIDYSMFLYWAQEVATNNLGKGATGTAINTFAQTILQYPNQGLQSLVNATAHESDTTTVTSNGWEFNLIYNPLRNWTMKITGNSDNAVNSRSYPGVQAYLANRLPIWTKASDPILGPFWTTIDAGNVGNDIGLSPQQYLATQVDAAGLDIALALQGQSQPDLSRYHFNYLTNYQFVSGELTGFGIGTALRYESRAVIGYLGGPPDPGALGAIDSYNVAARVYGKEVPHQDLWVSYRERLPFLDQRIRATLQVNCRDVWSNGYLLTVGVNPDASPAIFRIIPPRQWYLQETFDF